MYAREDDDGPSAALTGAIPLARGRPPFSEYSFVGGGPDLVFIVLPEETGRPVTPAPARDILEFPAPPVPVDGATEIPIPSAAADPEPQAEPEIPAIAEPPLEQLPDAVAALPTFDELLSRARDRFVLDNAIGPDSMPLPQKMIPVLFLPESGDLLPIDPLFGG